jgi:hypothetical protein
MNPATEVEARRDGWGDINALVDALKAELSLGHLRDAARISKDIQRAIKRLERRVGRRS